MSHHNVWIVLTENAKNILRPLLDDPDYNGQHLTAVKIFRKMIDYGTVEKMFKTPTVQGFVWYLFSITFNDIDGQAAQRVQDAFDHLEANYPNQFEVVGAWQWDGRQIGTQWELDTGGEPTGNTIGTPTYPINQTQLLKFMPDVWNGDEPPTYSPATELTDVNLIQGQTFRRFT